MIGTGTGVGKTWVAALLATRLRSAGRRVVARKPAQSFEPGDDEQSRDAAVLGRATGELPETVCPRHRWYEVAMAPPMAAEVLGRRPARMGDLVRELHWPEPAVDVGLVETAGGVRSPLALDGDAVRLCRVLEPDLVVLVADAGLGTINAVRLSADVIESPLVVVVNRFESTSDLQTRNLAWLRRDGLRVVALPGEEDELVRMVLSAN